MEGWREEGGEGQTEGGACAARCVLATCPRTVALAVVARRSRSSAVMHVTPELEVLGSNPDGVKGRNAVS